MGTHPSREFDENGVLVQRALASDVAGDADEQTAVTGRPADVAPNNTTFASRGKATAKAVSTADTENKAVGAKKTSKK